MVLSTLTKGKTIEMDRPEEDVRGKLSLTWIAHDCESLLAPSSIASATVSRIGLRILCAGVDASIALRHPDSPEDLLAIRSCRTNSIDAVVIGDGDAVNAHFWGRLGTSDPRTGELILRH